MSVQTLPALPWWARGKIISKYLPRPVTPEAIEAVGDMVAGTCEKTGNAEPLGMETAAPSATPQ